MTDGPKICPTIDLHDTREVSFWTRRVRTIARTLRPWSSINGAGLSHGCLRTWRACLRALASALLILFAATAVVAESDSVANTAKSAELEKRIVDIVQMFEKDPRYNRGRTPQQIKDSVEFVTGNVLFVLAHEAGHALISVFDLPVLGREEDAADALATVLALKMANPFADRVVFNAARSWFLRHQRDKEEHGPGVYYDEHGLDLQRAYNIVCLLVGGQPDKFTALANEVKLPKERQATCRFDFSNTSSSVEQALKPHLRKPEDPKTKIEVNYAQTSKYTDVPAVGRKLQILEIVAQWLSEDFAWTTPISLEMRQCGDDVSSRWVAREKKIIVCYEIVREFVQLYRQFGRAALVPTTAKVAKYGKPAGLVTTEKSRRSNGFRFARVPVPRQMTRTENPNGGM